MVKKKQKSDNILLLDLLIRYGIIFLAGLGNLYVFYLFLNPLTLYSSGSLLQLFVDSFYYDGMGYVVNGVTFLLVGACVGGSAFYLLFILVMSARGIAVLKRLTVLLFSFGVLFVFNICRILLMVYLYGSSYFDAVHWFFWYFLSTLFVVIIWMYDVKRFEISSIPLYSDVKFVVSSFTQKQGVSRIKKSRKKNIARKKRVNKK